MNKRRTWVIGLIWMTGAAWAPAEDPQTKAPGPVGQTIKGFVLDQRDPETGELKATLKGESAKVLTANRTEITNMTISLIEENKVGLSITSPKCNFWHTESRLSTNNSVRVVRDDLEIEAQNMEWEYKERRGVLRNKVKVTLKGLDLGSPAAKPASQTETAAP
jgi:hypothetical protein